mgnify:CR=1 FL=1
MNRLRVTLAAVGLWGCFGLSGLACELAESGSLDYALQEDNRCEGIQDRIQVSGSLDLISFTSTNGGSLGTTVRIRVPRRDRNQPFFRMQEPESRWLLERVPFTSQGDFYLYNLSTRILNGSDVDDLDDLRAIAVTGTQRVYLPTLLGSPARGYEFVFYSVDRVKFLKAEVRGTDIAWGPQGARTGEKSFGWSNANQTPAGRYEFYYEAEIEQGNRAPELIRRSIAFWHNPDWLR